MRISFDAGLAIRIFLFNVAVFISIGIWLTGYDVVHWFALAPPIALTAAAITGYCPGLLISKIIAKKLGK